MYLGNVRATGNLMRVDAPNSQDECRVSKGFEGFRAARTVEMKEQRSRLHSHWRDPVFVIESQIEEYCARSKRNDMTRARSDRSQTSDYAENLSVRNGPKKRRRQSHTARFEASVASRLDIIVS
jgi:hypothetical protein